MMDEGLEDKCDMKEEWTLGSYKVWAWSRGKGKWGTGESTKNLFKMPSHYIIFCMFMKAMKTNFRKDDIPLTI